MAFEDVRTDRGLLNQIRKLSANFGKCRSSETVDLTDGQVHSLTVPANCNYAEFRLYTTSAAANTPVAWFRNDGGTPAANAGIPLLGWEMWDRTDYENLIKFKIKGVGGTEKLYVQYYTIQF